MAKKIIHRILWLGRGTATMMGLALILAMIFGLASVALAGTGIGAPFNLGETNTVNRLSTLVGTVGSGANLLIDNNSTNTHATALNLQVEPGRAPMRVNSSTKVTKLNADQLDGKNSTDLVPGGTVPAGTTIRGSYVIGNSAAQAGRQAGSDSISFGYQLPSKPNPVFIALGAAATQQCPGTSESPQAKPGYLCVYEDYGFNESLPPDVDAVSTVGAGVFLYAKDAGASQSYGTWAVTVP